VVGAQSGGGDGPVDTGEKDAIQNVKESVESGSARSSTLPAYLRHLPEREQAQRLDQKKAFADQEHQLRQRYANWIIGILAAQLMVADGAFVAFAWAGKGWDLSPGVIEVWLGATVVQVVGIVLIVTRHLFPNRDRQPVEA
jgi:hypothetical protein